MLKVIELFAGIGSQTQALKNIGVEHEVVAISDNDEQADKSYRILHNPNVNNLGDITQSRPLDIFVSLSRYFGCRVATRLGAR